MTKNTVFSVIMSLVMLIVPITTAGPLLLSPVYAVAPPSVKVTPNANSTYSLTVTFSESIPTGNIVDFEAYDSSNQRKWQQYFTNGGTTFNATTSALSGTNVLKIGLFTPNWGSNYQWFDHAATLQPSTATVSVVPTTGVTATPSPTPTGTATQSATTVAPAQQNSSLRTTAMNNYNDWKAKYVVAGNPGSRVVRPENGNDTVSEGMGYGMLLAAFANDQQTFSNLWTYTKSHLNANGLMDWQISSSGSVIGKGGATDADEDIAYALVLASQKWSGSGYDVAANAMINSVLGHEVTQANYVTPGDGWGNTTTMNPSYLAISYYSTFASFSGNSRWNEVANINSNWLSRAAHPQTGLVPDWLASDMSQPSIGWDKYPNAFYYDAIRTPIRALIAYKTTGDSTAQNILQKEASFFASQGVSKLVSGYTLPGSPLSGYLDNSFRAAYAAAGQVNPDSQYGKDSMNMLVNAKSDGYFGDALRAVTLFVAAGM